jgi:hypothetical protein
MTDVAEEEDLLAKFDYEPPQVTYDPIVEDGKTVGFQVNPPFDPDWDHLVTLQHFAALIEHRTGHKIRVAKNDRKEGEFAYLNDLYDVLTDHATGGPVEFDIAWAWMSGFENGIHEILWATKEKRFPSS